MPVRPSSTLLLSATLLLAGGCSTTPDGCLLRAPRVPEVSGFRKIAVFPFAEPNGHSGDAARFTAALKGALASIRVGPTPYFELVGDAPLAVAVQAAGLDRADGLDASTARTIGRSLAVEGVVTGTVRIGVDREPYREARDRCVTQAPCDDLDACLLQGCAGSEAPTVSRTVSCAKVTASVTAIPHLTDVVTGQSVYTRRITENVSAAGCADTDLPSEQALLTQARNAVLGQISQDVAPWQACQALDLKTQPTFRGEDRERFTGALAFAEAGRIDRACAIFESLADAQPRDLALGYNIGVCHMIEGRLDAALTHMRRIERRLLRPDAAVTAALRRIEALKSDLAAAESRAARAEADAAARPPFPTR